MTKKNSKKDDAVKALEDCILVIRTKAKKPKGKTAKKPELNKVA